jgi:hypothetical protein
MDPNGPRNSTKRKRGMLPTVAKSRRIRYG